MFFRAATNSGTASPQIPNHREAWSLRVGSSTGPLASGPVSMWHCILVLKCLKHSLPIESLELLMLSYVSDLRCREQFLSTCVFPLLNLRKKLNLLLKDQIFIHSGSPVFIPPLVEIATVWSLGLHFCICPHTVCVCVCMFVRFL